MSKRDGGMEEKLVAGIFRALTVDSLESSRLFKSKFLLSYNGNACGFFTDEFKINFAYVL